MQNMIPRAAPPDTMWSDSLPLAYLELLPPTPCGPNLPLASSRSSPPNLLEVSRMPPLESRYNSPLEPLDPSI